MWFVPAGDDDRVIAPYPRSQANGVNEMFGLRPKDGMRSRRWSDMSDGADAPTTALGSDMSDA